MSISNLRRMRALRSFASKGIACYERHNVSDHGFINEMEEKLNMLGSTDELLELEKEGLVRKLAGSSTYYINLLHNDEEMQIEMAETMRMEAID